MKIQLTEIAEWQEDRGILSHMSEADALAILADEVRRKKEDEWTEGLPFTYEAEDGESETEAVERAVEAYAEKYCFADALQPVEAEYEVIEKEVK